LPRSLVSRRAENRGDDYDFLFVHHLIDHAVGKAIWLLPSNVL
jgi:hypothetical protein